MMELRLQQTRRQSGTHAGFREGIDGLRQKPASRLEPGPNHGEQRSAIEHEVGHRINSSLFFLLVVLPTASFS